MFNSTKPHKETINGKQRIMIGKTVPEGAVNLAYYYNKRANDGMENIIVSEAPKSTIDHITVTEYESKSCCPTKDEKYFSNVLFYSDSNGYEGGLALNNIKWYDHKHHFEKEVTKTKEFTVTEMDIPEKSIEYSENNDFGITLSGTLGVVNIDYIPLEYKTVTTEHDEKKFIRETRRVSGLSNTSQSMDNSIQYSNNGYSGTLTKVSNSERYIPSFSDCSVSFKYTTTNGNSSSIVVDGITLPLLETTGELVTRRGYGFCRYWGSSSTGTCGNSGNTFTNSTPDYENSMYKPNAIKYLAGPTSGTPANELGGLEGNCFYDLSYSKDGVNYTSHWTKDIATAKEIANAYGISHNGGNMWIANSNMVNDIFNRIGSPSEVASWMNCSSITSDSDGLSYPVISPQTFASTITSRLAAYSHVWFRNGSEPASEVTQATTNDIYANRPGVLSNTSQRYFRDSVGFYRGVVKSIVSKYGKNVINCNSISYILEADYEGEVTKTTTETKQVPIKWKAVATYVGTIKGGYIDYNGKAEYVGVATKKDDIGNINPIGNNVKFMYPDDNGLLYENINKPSSCNLESEQFYITDVIQDGVPLFYSYRLKNLIYDPIGPDDFGMFQGDSIKLINSRNKPLPTMMKYAVKLTPAKYRNTYYADVYTSFVVNGSNPIKCMYISYDDSDDNKLKANTLEDIYVQPAFQRNVEYSVNNVDPIQRKNKITINNPLIINDSRKKVNFEYEIVLFNDGVEKYKSKPINATAINHRYSLDKEKSNFIGRNYIVSPLSQSEYKTGYEILAADNTNFNSTGIFVARLTDNPINNSVKNVVNLFIEPDGNSVVSAEILTDTGFKDSSNDNKYTKRLTSPDKYVISDNKIRCAYAVKCIDCREIKVVHPKENSLLKNWYPGIQFGHASQVFGFRGVKKKYIYSMPEFNNQEYCSYGRPYVRVNEEKAEYINNYTIKLNRTPIYVRLNENKEPINLSIKIVDSLGNSKSIEPIGWYFEEGLVKLKNTISESDNIIVTYDYSENEYLYRGYYDDDKFAEIDFNTNMYHRYLDIENTSKTTEKTSMLLNKTVYFFARPSMIIEDFTGDGDIRYDEKEATSYLTSEDHNSFPDMVSVSEEDYSGEIGKNGEPYLIADGVTWRQNYKGVILKPLIAQASTEIVFAISRHSATRTNIKELEKRIRKLYGNLKASGISDIKLGLCVFSDIYKDISFNNSKFTTNIDELISAITKELSITSNTASKAFTAIKHIAESYPFTTSAKNIVLITSIAANDNNVLYNASSICNEKLIKVHNVCDTNDYYSRTIVILSNETTGSSCTITNDEWENLLTIAIGTVCNLGEIKLVYKNTIYHKIEDDKPDIKHDLYIGSTFVRHYTSLNAVELVDSRNLGGGLIEGISDDLRRELEPESDYYFDVGYWDGEPYSENAVIIIRLDKRLLVNNGGKFTENDIEVAVNKWVSAGTIPIIEYVNAENGKEELNNKLEVESVNINKISNKPQGTIKIELS